VNMAPQWGLKNIPTLRAAFGYANVPASGQIAAGNYTVSGPPDNPATLFIVLETSKSGYFKADYGFSLFGFPVDGNVGLRFTDYTLTEQANNSIVTGSGAAASLTFVPTVGSHETSILLPSWNAKVTLADNLFMRLSASETATRPSFSQLNPATSYSLGGTTLQSSASSGNPNLSSEKSINLDGDVEYYWGKANHVSAAVFHRYVEGYIQNQTSQVTQGGVLYNFTKPVNFQNSYIDGTELAYSQFLDFLPDFWSGFGWDINGTYIAPPVRVILRI
jgi:TonB-dependent receptor